MEKIDCLALILAGGRGSRLDILSEKRSKPAVPFAGKFRIIDFALSNCTNSGIYQIGILTQYLPLSLNDHIGVGKPWDLDRRDSFCTLLQPNNDWYQGTADSVRKNLEFLQRYDQKYTLILSGDHVYKMDYRKLIKQHEEKGADLTICAKIVPMEEADRFGILETDENLKINKFVEKPKKPTSNKASMGIYVFTTKALVEALKRHDDIKKLDFGKHIIPEMIQNKNVYAYEYYDYWKDVGTYDSYMDTNLELIHNTSLDLYATDWKIYTKSEDLPPVRAGNSASIKRCLVSNGSSIDGQIQDCVISPGVRVGEGSIVRNCIILNDVHIGKNCIIENSIFDKNTIIGDNCIIGHGPVTCSNISKPELLKGGINVIGKGLNIPSNTKIARNVRVCTTLKRKKFPKSDVPCGDTLE